MLPPKFKCGHSTGKRNREYIHTTAVCKTCFEFRRDFSRLDLRKLHYQPAASQIEMVEVINDIIEGAIWFIARGRELGLSDRILDGIRDFASMFTIIEYVAFAGRGERFWDRDVMI